MREGGRGEREEGGRRERGRGRGEREEGERGERGGGEGNPVCSPCTNSSETDNYRIFLRKPQTQSQGGG